MNTLAVRLGKQASERSPDWKSYAGAAQHYLDRPAFSGTQLTGKLFADAARKAHTRTGTYVPPQLALNQAQWESGMGRRGRSPRTNPFNIGEFDSGTRQSFRTPAEGVQAYYNQITKSYLTKGRTMQDLMRKFVDVHGRRYASNPQYEANLRKQLPVINRSISEYMKSQQPVAEKNSELHQVCNENEVMASARTSPAGRGHYDRVRVTGLHVKPAYRGRGVASQLMDKIKAANRGRTLELRPHPSAGGPKTAGDLRQMYAHLGFQSGARGKMLMAVSKGGV